MLWIEVNLKNLGNFYVNVKTSGHTEEIETAVLAVIAQKSKDISNQGR